MAVVVGLAVPTYLQTMPPPGSLATRFAPNPGDPVFLMWTMAWASDSSLPELLQGNQFFDSPDTIAWADPLLGYLPVFAPAYLLTDNPVLAFNAVVFLAYLLGGLAVYWLALELFGRRHRGGAFLAALLFTLVPYRSLSLSHPQLAGFFFVPLALLFLVRFLQRGRRVRDAAALGACAAGAFLTTSYYAVVLGVVVGVVALGWVVVCRRSLGRVVELVRGALVAGGVATVLVAPVVPTYLALARSGRLSRPVDEVLAYTVRAEYFTQVPPSLFYRALGVHSAVATRDLGGYWPGAVLLACVLAGVVGWTRRRGDDAWSAFRWPLVAAGLVSFLVMIGPGRDIGSWPYRLMHRVVPGMAAMRDIGRFWTVPLLVLALFAGWSVRGWARRPVVVVVLALVACVELVYRPPMAKVDLSDRALAVNRRLARMPADAVTELPSPSKATVSTYPFVVTPRLLRSTVDRLPRLEGYTANRPAGFASSLRAAAAFPDPDAVRRLQAAGVRYVVLHGGAKTQCSSSRYQPHELTALVALARATPGVRRVIEVGDDAIAELRPLSSSVPHVAHNSTMDAQMGRWRSACPDQ